MNIYKVTKTHIMKHDNVYWILSNHDTVNYFDNGYRSIYTGAVYTPIFSHDGSTVINFMK